MLQVDATTLSTPLISSVTFHLLSKMRWLCLHCLDLSTFLADLLTTNVEGTIAALPCHRKLLEKVRVKANKEWGHI